ncbi:MAG: hypothetical protein ACREJ3_18795, partial [Polyangiaceae bacterium]
MSKSKSSAAAIVTEYARVPAPIHPFAGATTKVTKRGGHLGKSTSAGSVAPPPESSEEEEELDAAPRSSTAVADIDAVDE